VRNRVGTNTAQQHQHDRDERAGDFVHRRARRLERGQAPREVALDILDHDDRVVDDDADRQHQPEQRQVVERVSERRSTVKVPISDTGIATTGMIAARQLLQEDDDDEHDEQDRFEQRVITASIDWAMNSVGL
jgi:hypothetical protein